MFCLSSLGFAMLAIQAAAAVTNFPLICLSSPPLPLQAGQTIVATIDNPKASRCDARLKFADPSFLDVNFGFSFVDCLGSQIAEFIVPPEVPNGDALIIWECADRILHHCSHVSITLGSANAEAIIYDQQGSIGCLVPTATLTTLSTVTGSSTTYVEPVTVTAFSTSFMSSTTSQDGPIPTTAAITTSGRIAAGTASTTATGTANTNGQMNVQAAGSTSTTPSTTLTTANEQTPRGITIIPASNTPTMPLTTSKAVAGCSTVVETMVECMST